MWKAVNKATNRKPKLNTIPDFVNTRAADGSIKKSRCKTDIANAMNKQFSEMGSRLAEKLDPSEVNFADYLESPSRDSFFIEGVIEPEVEERVEELDINKAIGYHGIPPKLLKWEVQFLFQFLQNYLICVLLKASIQIA